MQQLLTDSKDKFSSIQRTLFVPEGQLEKRSSVLHMKHNSPPKKRAAPCMVQGEENNQCVFITVKTEEAGMN